MFAKYGYLCSYGWESSEITNMENMRVENGPKSGNLGPPNFQTGSNLLKQKIEFELR